MLRRLQPDSIAKPGARWAKRNVGLKCLTDGHRGNRVWIRGNRTKSKAVINRKFKVGESIEFTSPFRGRFSVSGSYTIVAYRPREDGTEPSYVIKRELDEHQRIASESELHHGPDQSDR